MKTRVNYLKTYRFLIASICLCAFCHTQMEAQTEKKLVKYNGSINLSSALYYTDSTTDRFNPFSWRIVGRQNIKLWKFNAPLRFLLSSSGKELDYNLSRIGFKPRYKSYRFYLGHTTMRFSEYTLARKNIFGAGVEGNPGWFRFGAMYGKIRNFRLKQNFLDEFGASSIRSFERKAIGGKIGIGKQSNYLDIIGFKSIDEIAETTEGDTSTHSPNENFILGAKLHLRPLNRLNFETNIAASGFTNDRRDDPLLEDNSGLKSIYNPTVSSRLNFAGHVLLKYALKQSNFGIKYKRVDPLFRSLGSSFFQNDLEEITGNFAWRSKTGKLTLSSNLGIFRDNISKTKVRESRRVVSSLFVNAAPNDRFGISASFSNYQRSTEGQIVEFNDTLRQVSVSRNLNLSSNYRFLNSESITLAANGFIGLQQFNDVSNITVFQNSYNSFSSNIGFRLELVHYHFSIHPSLLYSNYNFLDRETIRYGLRLAVQKLMLDQRIQLSSNVSLLYNDIEQKRNGQVLKYQFQSLFKINSKNALHFRILGIQRSSVIANDFSEYRILTGYGINF